MTTTSVLAVPGIHRVDQTFLRALAAMVDRHGWDIDGIAGVMSHESGFDASAHSPLPNQTATGLIQMIETTARTLGTTTAALRTMSALQQLPYIERFFERYLTRIPSRPEDYTLATYGRSDLINAPDDVVVDRENSSDPKEVERYKVNAPIDTDHKGWISVGDLRTWAGKALARAAGKRVQITPPPVSGDGGGGGGAGAGGAGLLAVLGGALVVAGIMKRRRLAPRELDTGLREVEHDGKGLKRAQHLAALLGRHRIAAHERDCSKHIAAGPLEREAGEHLGIDEPRTRSTFEEEVALGVSVFRDQRCHPRVVHFTRGLPLTAVP